MSKDSMLNDMRSLGFVLKSKSTMHSSLAQFCNQSIKKIYSTELMETVNSRTNSRSQSNLGQFNTGSAGNDDKNTLGSFMLNQKSAILDKRKMHRNVPVERLLDQMETP